MPHVAVRVLARAASASLVRRLTAFIVAAAAAAPASTLVAEQRGERAMGGIGISVYEDANFRGRSATFRNDVPDVGRAAGMNDRISSLRVARGETWEVCEHINYGGRCEIVTGSESNLGNQWNDEISSLRRVRGGAVRPPFGGGFRGRIVLFDERRFRGRSISVDRVEGYLSSFNDRAESVQVFGGAWELCEDSEFRGRCITVTSNRADLGSLRGKVSSARPVRR